MINPHGTYIHDFHGRNGICVFHLVFAVSHRAAYEMLKRSQKKFVDSLPEMDKLTPEDFENTRAIINKGWVFFEENGAEVFALYFHDTTWRVYSISREKVEEARQHLVDPNMRYKRAWEWIDRYVF